MLKNLFHLFSKTIRIIIYLVLVTLLTGIWWYFTDIRIMFGNYGNVHTYTDIGLSTIIILLFPILIISIFYKALKYWKRTDIEWKTITWVVSGVLWTIISGASCCGSTLALSFGLLPLMSFLPYDWLELKILGLIGLIYWLINTLKHLETCQRKKIS
jgi:membrane protease YdiL (CAAX protease family)